jgi:hypothetical protein
MTAADRQPGLMVRELTKNYIMPGGVLEVLKGIDLDVFPGENRCYHGA